jgi:alpha-beta hydrolase superfamily lysophospholipase
MSALGWCAVIACSALAHAEESYPLSIPAPPGSPPVYRRFEVSGRDKTKLIVHEWSPRKAQADKPVVLFIHGIAFHGEPYRAIAAGFTEQGVTLIAPDLRGHGRSEGPRGQLPPPHVLRADIGAVIDEIHHLHSDAPVVLLGDSMGGLIAADYAWRGEQRLAGLALFVPAFGLNKELWQKGGVDLAGILRRGGVNLANESKIAPSTRSEGFLKARLTDSLSLREVTSGYLLTILALQREWPRVAEEIKMPLFVCVAGEDKIIDNDAARQVFEHAASPTAEKTWLKVDGAYHTLCWDPTTPQTIAELVKWVLKRSK